jgi:hypothetical protein
MGMKYVYIYIILQHVCFTTTRLVISDGTLPYDLVRPVLQKGVNDMSSALLVVADVLVKSHVKSQLAQLLVDTRQHMRPQVWVQTIG